jgi:predicted glycosyltransferase involved in capsule biosynthesis
MVMNTYVKINCECGDHDHYVLVDDWTPESILKALKTYDNSQHWMIQIPLDDGQSYIVKHTNDYNNFFLADVERFDA